MKLGISRALAVVAVAGAAGLLAQYSTAACGSSACGAPVVAKAKCATCAAGKACEKCAAKKAALKKGGGKCATAACASRCGAKKAHDVPVIDTKALATLLAAKTDITVLDARSGKWDDGRRIPGAKGLSASAADADIAKVAPDKDGLIVTYCSSTKCPASAMLAGKLRKLGYKNVIEYPKGIDGWQEAGQTVVKTK